MTAIITDAPPHRNDLPSLVLDIGEPPVGIGPVQLQCAARNTADTLDQQFEDIETFCHPGAEAPTIARGTLSVELVWSFGPVGTASMPGQEAGVWNALKQIEGDLVEYAFLPISGDPSSESNPEEWGELYVPGIPFIDAGVRRHSLITLEFKIFGSPNYNTDGTTVFDHPFGGS